MDNLQYDEVKCSDYLKFSHISTDEAKLLFKLRTRMYAVKNNFKGRYLNDLNCRLCSENSLENQEHLLECSILKNCIPELSENTDIKYHHIFGNLTEMKAAAKLFTIVCEKHEELIDSLS